MNTSQTVIEESPNGRYKRFNTLIGTGSFKKVYLAFDSVEGRDVAWSEVSLVETTSEEMNRFKNEVDILRSVNSEYIIHYFDSWYDNENNRIVIITQYMPSGTILEYIQNKDVSIEAIKKWAIQILKGLAYLHSQTPPIIHKDLKCSNLFIDGIVSTIRIGDLGLASHSNTKSVISGTLEYMSPEVLDSNIYDEKSDMYAFGMCLLEIITRKSPYNECQTTVELISKVLAGIPPSSLNEVEDVSVRELILQLIGKPEGRPSAQELLSSPLLLPKVEKTAVKECFNNIRNSVSHETQPSSCCETPSQNYPRLVLQLSGDDKEGDSENQDILFIDWVSNNKNVITIKIIRQFSKPSKKPFRLVVQYTYGEDKIEGLISWLIALHIITEAAVKQIVEKVNIWLSDCVKKEISAISATSEHF